jgi:hypothetical protein
VARLGILTIFTTLLLVAPVWASEVGHDGGEGTYGVTNDKVVTNAGFLIIGGIPLLIFLLSLLQWRLDKRKDDRKKAAKGRQTAQVWRGGW